jgi:hypothetical protein
VEVTNACFTMPERIRAASMPKGFATPDGLIVRVAQCAFSNDPPQMGRSILFESRDGGYTMQFVSTIGTASDARWGNEGPCEPTATLLTNGDYLCVMRTGCDITGAPANGAPLLLARSSDQGRTWTRTKMSMGGVMPKILRMSNGLLVIATGRPGNRLYFSSDDGNTWGREVWLTSPQSLTTGYCDVLEVAPGRLLAVYDLFNTDTKGFWLWEPREVNAVYGVFVDVQHHLEP